VIFVDTSVWSLALRRDRDADHGTVARLRSALEAGEQIFSTGIVLQELLQGFNGPNAKKQILSHFSALPIIVPQRQDYIDAADLRNLCRRSGVQVATIDALIAQICVRHGLTLLTTDSDFHQIKKHAPLRMWQA
jgi:predicted nucleic acid-binding protein